MRPFYLPKLFGSKKFLQVHGGPYRQRPEGHFGVKMAAEIKAPCDVSIPTEDYSVPDVKALSDGLTQTLKFMAQNRKAPVYVGCMGGIGRTGLFMAVMAKAFGVDAPVPYVRQFYYGHAVETQEQREFVEAFQITPAQRRLALVIKVKNLF